MERISSISRKISYSVILAGLFSTIVFIAATYQNLNPNLYVVLIPLTAFIFLFGFAIGQKVSIPVKEILKEADYLSKGNTKIRFSSKEGDEVGQLAKVLNKIAEDLEINKSKVESLDTQIKLRTKALEEIIRVLEQKIKNRTLEFQRMLEESEKNQLQLRLREVEIKELQKRVSESKAKKGKLKRGPK